MSETKVCQICGSDAKFMKGSKTHCNCSNKDCLLYGDKYFHVDKWNKRSASSVPSKEKILEVVMNSEFYKNIIQYKEAKNFTKEIKNLINDLHALITERK